MDEKNIRDAVKSLREESGLSQTSLAIKLGRSTSSIQRYENITPPKRAELAKYVHFARECGKPDVARELKAIALEGIPQELIDLIREDDEVEPASKKTAPSRAVDKRRISA
jgi:transcriptional regulator with XRE-family HTH domain